MSTITNKIIRRIYAKQRGWVFTPKVLLDLGNRAVVDKVLSRLVTRGVIRRLDRGVYDYPKKHKTIGLLSPSTADLAHAIAADEIVSSGAMAANLLGLSTQVPAKPIYVTNGAPRKKRIAGRVVTIKHSRVPILNHVSVNVNLALQALYYLGKSNIDDSIIKRCYKLLHNKDKKALNRATAKVPGWMVDAIHKIQQIA